MSKDFAIGLFSGYLYVVSTGIAFKLAIVGFNKDGPDRAVVIAAAWEKMEFIWLWTVASMQVFIIGFSISTIGAIAVTWAAIAVVAKIVFGHFSLKTFSVINFIKGTAIGEGDKSFEQVDEPDKLATDATEQVDVRSIFYDCSKADIAFHLILFMIIMAIVMSINILFVSPMLTTGAHFSLRL